MLAGGVARQGETCGAIIGALLALGLVIGREGMGDIETYEAAMGPALEVYTRFREELKKQFGFKEEIESTLCRHIQERIYGRAFDLADEKERQTFHDSGGHSESGCPKVCGIAAQMAAEKIIELSDRYLGSSN